MNPFGTAAGLRMMSERLAGSGPISREQMRALRLHLLGAAERLERRESMTVVAERRAEAELRQFSVHDIDRTFEPRGWFVYLLLAGEEVLYVGSSRNVLARLGDHLSSPEKRLHVTRVRLIRCHNRAAMLRAETRLIRAWLPKWNVAMKPAACRETVA